MLHDQRFMKKDDYHGGDDDIDDDDDDDGGDDNDNSDPCLRILSRPITCRDDSNCFLCFASAWSKHNEDS